MTAVHQQQKMEFTEAIPVPYPLSETVSKTEKKAFKDKHLRENPETLFSDQRSYKGVKSEEIISHKLTVNERVTVILYNEGDTGVFVINGSDGKKKKFEDWFEKMKMSAVTNKLEHKRSQVSFIPLS